MRGLNWIFGPFIVAVIIIGIAWHAGAGWGILAILATLGLYAASVRLFPRRNCWRCNGRGEYQDRSLWRGTLRHCRVCHGHGWRIRWGVRLLNSARYREMKSAHSKGGNW